MTAPGRSLHVVFTKEALEPARLSGKVVIVVDILFATTTLTHVLAEGAADVRVAYGEQDAHQLKADIESPLLAGELNADTIAGFAPATPLALSERGVTGRNVIYASTNGTVALLRATPKAEVVYAASLLNGAAVARRIADAQPRASVLIVCAGSAGRFNLEDSYGAGHVAEHLLLQGDYECSDATLAALYVRHRHPPIDALSESAVGRRMRAHGLADEIALAARADSLSVVPVMSAGQRIRSVT